MLCPGQNSDFGSRNHSVAGLSASKQATRIGLEDQMDTQSPDARALIWTGLSLAVIIVGAAIAFAVFT
jgi:hypothetical protein